MLWKTPGAKWRYTTSKTFIFQRYSETSRFNVELVNEELHVKNYMRKIDTSRNREKLRKRIGKRRCNLVVQWYLLKETLPSKKGNRHGNVDDFLTIKESSTVKETSISREETSRTRTTMSHYIYIAIYIYIYFQFKIGVYLIR